MQAFLLAANCTINGSRGKSFSSGIIGLCFSDPVMGREVRKSLSGTKNAESIITIWLNNKTVLFDFISGLQELLDRNQWTVNEFEFDGL